MLNGEVAFGLHVHLPTSGLVEATAFWCWVSLLFFYFPLAVLLWKEIQRFATNKRPTCIIESGVFASSIAKNH